jgi:hypothetical protein
MITVGDCFGELNAEYYTKADRRRWQTAICGGLPFPQAGFFSENHLESGEVICLHGGSRLCCPYIGRMNK